MGIEQYVKADPPAADGLVPPLDSHQANEPPLIIMDDNKILNLV